MSHRRVVSMCRAQGMDLSIPVALLHVAAFSMGYFICKGLGFNEKTCRTVSIETGNKAWGAFARLHPFTSPHACMIEQAPQRCLCTHWTSTADTEYCVLLHTKIWQR